MSKELAKRTFECIKSYPSVDKGTIVSFPFEPTPRLLDLLANHSEYYTEVIPNKATLDTGGYRFNLKVVVRQGLPDVALLVVMNDGTTRKAGTLSRLNLGKLISTARRNLGCPEVSTKVLSIGKGETINITHKDIMFISDACEELLYNFIQWETYAVQVANLNE